VCGGWIEKWVSDQVSVGVVDLGHVGGGWTELGSTEVFQGFCLFVSLLLLNQGFGFATQDPVHFFCLRSISNEKLNFMILDV